MIFAIELKKYMANVGIFDVVVGKLCYEKKLCPIILLKVDKSSKVGFYCTILSLNLAVHLGIKSGGEFLLDAKEII